jgi:hypothetical protein
MRRTEGRIGTILAERRLQRLDFPRRTVVVSLGRPRRRMGSQDWECPFRIRGLGVRRIEYAYGVDAFQALTMALEGIRYLVDQCAIPLAWKGVREDHTGFQRLIPLLPEPGGTSRLERIVDKEARLRLKRLKPRRQSARRRA